MTIIQYIYLYLVAVGSFLAVDALWLGLIARDFYAKQLDGVINMKVNFLAAGVFYAIFLVGVIYFAILPALKTGKITDALLYGGLFGFFTYATYDLTNLATIQNWPMRMVVIDMIWGVVLSGTISVICFLFAKNFLQ